MEDKNVGQTSENTKKQKKSAPVKRAMKGEEEIHHDLFRLEAASTRKNISFNKIPLWEPIDHKHFYHNVDSDGKPQEHCSPTASHFHSINIKEIDGKLVATCSAPMKMGYITDPNTGRKRKGPVEYKNDEHTHEITYLQSEMITRRVFSEDALNRIAAIEARNADRMKNPAL